MATRTFGEDRVLGLQRHATLEGRADAAVLLDAHVAGGDADDAARLVVQHFGRGEAGIDLDPQLLGLSGEPAAQIAQADDVIAVVAHLRRRRQAKRPLFGEEQEPVLGGRGVERGAALRPIGEKFVEGPRLEDRARKDMGADLRAFLEDADG